MTVCISALDSPLGTKGPSWAQRVASGFSTKPTKPTDNASRLKAALRLGVNAIKWKRIYGGDYALPEKLPRSYLERSSLIADVRRFLEIADGFDGYSGRPPNHQAVLDAIALANGLPTKATVPRVAVAGDGEIGFFWEGVDYFVDIGIQGDGTFSYFARMLQMESLYGDDVSIADGFPQALEAMLASIADSTR